ncbi:MAG: hypothetical protein A2V52_02110 [Actinobacteria bacterium RBG_19FT_COMBO_54_7]|uniref:Peptidase MA-like domain-containing protein n=1 Tax=Candidatus Solincola sediminis TaxID=1797199 RepID=A0A1F2WIP3_9ACTN|nr:MAG: hypothetical protein A2Y75_08025 [Candidatus Solincola sediminis]OFW59752.1 MAG: hypothetical protein A2W01_03370 [Candidatus Solincola sediminis]OFW70770.1 MAG: hypothetical protein A2V52_02110 [Actinobacteria bacterium RBG_19FT_COMBO_54_7]
MRKFFAVLMIAIFLISISLTAVFAQGNQSEVNEVLEQDEEIRDLQASQSIKVDYLSQDALRQKMIEDIDSNTPEEIMDTQNIYILLGFIPEDSDLRQLYINLLTGAVAGLYDPEDKSLFLISEEKNTMSVMDRFYLSHELIHYLQDQNFNLYRPPFADPEGSITETDDDAAMAASALVEGDAQIAQISWMIEELNASENLELQAELGNQSTDVLKSTPAYLVDSLMFQYEEGQTFVQYLKRKGGYDAVDKAYANPPVSTEQIYHPEKYTANEAPVSITMDDASAKLGEGWALAYDNVLGEFDVYELFKPYFSDAKAETAAAGWGGNNYHYYRSDSGEKLLVQDYAWDSDKDAQEFASAYINLLDVRFKGDISGETPVGAWQTWSAGGYQLGIKKDGLNTYLIQSTAEEPFTTMIESLGETGDQIDRQAIDGDDVSGAQGDEQNYKWLVIAGVIGLLALGIVLLIVMLILLRKPPAPPSQQGGPYGYGGGSPGQWGSTPWQGGYVPPPPPPGGMPPTSPPA